MKLIKRYKKSLSIALLLVGGFIGISYAADLSYTTLVPQTGDSELILTHKRDVVTAPKVYKNVTTTGTTSIACASLDRIVVGTAGTGNASLVITDGTNAISTMSALAQVSLTYNVVITTGTVNVVVSGTGTAPNLTVETR